MSKDKTKRCEKPVPKVSKSSLSTINLKAAGIDIGSKEHYVAVPAECSETPVRSFLSFTADLNDLADWLAQCGIETVAMESTGVYWIPLYDILSERGFEVHLVNARHVKNVSGRKTDVLDCQWLQQLHSYGLLSGCFRPDDMICQLRGYQRHRDMLLDQAAKHILHMQKAMTQMNLKLHNVLSDIMGKTGMQIIRAIVAGERDLKKLASYRDSRCKQSEEVIEKSLQGYYREEHLFALKQALELYDIYQDKLIDCDKAIEGLLCQFESKVDEAGLSQLEKASKRYKTNAPDFDLHKEIYRMTGVNFDTLPGMSSYSVFKIISETGLDMSCWKSEKHFASWLGLCPGNKVTGGRSLSGKTKPSANKAASVFRMCASTLYHSGSALGAFHRRMKGRLGPAKAVTATANKLAKLFYLMLKNKTDYFDSGEYYYEERYQERLIKNLKRRAESLGFELVASPITSGFAKG
jgi:transposase